LNRVRPKFELALNLGAPGLVKSGFIVSAGIVPIVAADLAAHEDALERVPEFLAQYLHD